MSPPLALLLYAAHVLGAVLWLGGIVTAALVVATVAPDARREAAGAARKVVLWVVTPGLLLAWVAGLANLLPSFGALYARAGWMHGKLTVVLLATALTGVATGRIRRLAAGAAGASAGALRPIAWLVLALSAVALSLVFLRPGA